MQPWRFVVVADPAVKRRIREAAESEEREFHARRAAPEWLAALAPIGTDADQLFLETAPYLVVLFAQSCGVLPDGRKVKNDDVRESVGTAPGRLIAAVHHAGLACLTHTPSPMRFLSAILGRLANERPFLVLLVGHPAAGVGVPLITGKPLDAIATFVG
jgi:nitroreductase